MPRVVAQSPRPTPHALVRPTPLLHLPLTDEKPRVSLRPLEGVSPPLEDTLLSRLPVAPVSESVPRVVIPVAPVADRVPAVVARVPETVAPNVDIRVPHLARPIPALTRLLSLPPVVSYLLDFTPDLLSPPISVRTRLVPPLIPLVVPRVPLVVLRVELVASRVLLVVPRVLPVVPRVPLVVARVLLVEDRVLLVVPPEVLVTPPRTVASPAQKAARRVEKPVGAGAWNDLPSPPTTPARRLVQHRPHVIRHVPHLEPPLAGGPHSSPRTLTLVPLVMTKVTLLPIEPRLSPATYLLLPRALKPSPVAEVALRVELVAPRVPLVVLRVALVASRVLLVVPRVPLVVARVLLVPPSVSLVEDRVLLVIPRVPLVVARVVRSLLRVPPLTLPRPPRSLLPAAVTLAPYIPLPTSPVVLLFTPVMACVVAVTPPSTIACPAQKAARPLVKLLGTDIQARPALEKVATTDRSVDRQVANVDTHLAQDPLVAIVHLAVPVLTSAPLDLTKCPLLLTDTPLGRETPLLVD